MADTQRICFRLLDNALDYLERAAEEVHEVTPQGWKYALLHLSAGIELLLKARLEREHWSLLFANMDKASPLRMQSGDFESIDFSSALARLENIAAVKIPKLDRARLEEIRKHRNRVQHFAMDVDDATVKSLMAHGYGFCLRFILDEFRTEMSQDRRTRIDAMVRHLVEFRDFVSHRKSMIAESLGRAKRIEDCPECDQDCLAIGAGNPVCLFCGFSAEPSSAADRAAADFIDRCPACKGPFVVTRIDSTGVTGTCYACALHGEFDACERCGDLSESLDNDWRCPACRALVSVLRG